MKLLPRNLSAAAFAAIVAVLLATPLSASEARTFDGAVSVVQLGSVRFEVAQSNGMSLSQAVESVRRRGNVERVISAETQVSGGREIHVIKVLTKDGKVRTHRVNGRRRG